MKSAEAVEKPINVACQDKYGGKLKSSTKGPDEKFTMFLVQNQLLKATLLQIFMI